MYDAALAADAIEMVLVPALVCDRARRGAGVLIDPKARGQDFRRRAVSATKWLIPWRLGRWRSVLVVLGSWDAEDVMNLPGGKWRHGSDFGRCR